MNDYQDMPGHLIRRLNQISTSVFMMRMAGLGHDLTPVQFAALSALASHPGIDQATLAGMIAHDRATLGAVIARLEARGYVQRQTSQRDRRARVLALTDAGRALLGPVTRAVQAIQPEILSGLTDAERATLVALLHKTTQAGNDLSRAPLRLPPDQ